MEILKNQLDSSICASFRFKKKIKLIVFNFFLIYQMHKESIDDISPTHLYAVL